MKISGTTTTYTIFYIMNIDVCMKYDILYKIVMHIHSCIYVYSIGQLWKEKKRKYVFVIIKWIGSSMHVDVGCDKNFNTFFEYPSIMDQLDVLHNNRKYF